MDGLERLLVVCVGLDAPAGPQTLEARSMLYRAITRAHMMVLVVNEFVPSGWLSFLTGVTLGEDRKLDAAKRVNRTHSKYSFELTELCLSGLPEQVSSEAHQ